MSVNRKRCLNTCTACHKRASNVKAGLCQKCAAIAAAEAQLSALHVAAMRREMSEARNA